MSSFAARFTVPVLLITSLLLVPASIAQDTRVGLHVGLNADHSDVFIGLNGHVGLRVSERDVIAAITAELYPFLDDAATTVLEFNALLPGRFVGVDVYGGGGLAIRRTSFDIPVNSDLPTSDTDVGLNIKGGVVFGDEYSGFRPFLELDQSIGIGTDTYLRGGVFFTLGGGR